MPDVDHRAALERAVRNDPRNARLRYLFGAELAQMRDYDAAVSEMRRALELDASLHIARFQLGLLHLTMGHPELSLEVWAPLEAQPELFLRHFKRGLEALIRDEFATCIEALEAGIRANQTNAPLNTDMQLIIGKVRELTARDGSPPGEGVRTDFSLYHS
jgi:tetratricopeptide (TPR) repeat protein